MDALLATSPLSREHPLWRLLLLSDGSVTRHLQLLTGSAVTVDCLGMEPVPTGDSGLPPAVAELEHPLLQREVRRSDPAPAELAILRSEYSSALRGPMCHTACRRMGELKQNLHVRHNTASTRKLGFVDFWLVINALSSVSARPGSSAGWLRRNNRGRLKDHDGGLRKL